MPRTPKHTKEELISRAMIHFWAHGYEASSIGDLVQATGVSRHGIYGDFGGKHHLFLACLDHYDRQIVSPAFQRVETPKATLEQVLAFYHFNIDRSEAKGLPGSGCLMANTLTEVAPHDRAIRQVVNRHILRLRNGFKNAIRNELAQAEAKRPIALPATIQTMVVFTLGLWSLSRVTGDAGLLRQSAEAFVASIRKGLTS